MLNLIKLTTLFFALLFPTLSWAESFFKGFEASFFNEMENCGAIYTEGGSNKDPIQIMADYGANIVRVRLFHNPLAWTESPSNFSSFDDAKATILRAKNLNLNVLLTLHYSDTFADPNNQTIPAAWAASVNNQSALETEIYNYTHQVLTDLSNENLLPDFVQIGNEINGNILSENSAAVYPINWPRQSALINSAISAVRDFDTSASRYTKVVLHVSDPAAADAWFSQASANNVSDYDVIGLSYFPEFHSTSIAATGNIVSSLRSNHKKNVMIVETGAPWTTTTDDSASNVVNSLPASYGAPSISAQQSWMNDLMNEMLDHEAVGLIYWEPGWVSTNCTNKFCNVGSHWENATFFDFNNELIPNGAVDFLTQPIPYIGSFSSGITNTGGVSGSGITGQAFTAIENASPNPGLPNEVFLQQLSFTQSNNLEGSISTRVEIYRPDTTLATSELIGVSTNTVNTTAPSGSIYKFQFESLSLQFNTTYIAIFKDSNNNLINLSLMQNSESDPSIEEYVSGGAIFNYDSSGWNTNINTDFNALYSTVSYVNVPVLGLLGKMILISLILMCVAVRIDCKKIKSR